MWQIIGPILAHKSRGSSLFNVLAGGKPHIHDGEILPQETRNTLYDMGQKVFIIWNCLGVTHECDAQTDSLIAYATLHYVPRPINILYKTQNS